MSSLPVAPPRRRDEEDGPAEGIGSEAAAAPRASRLNAEGSACFIGWPRGIMLRNRRHTRISPGESTTSSARSTTSTHQSSIKWSLPEPQFAQARTTLRFEGFGPLVSYTRHWFGQFCAGEDHRICQRKCTCFTGRTKRLVRKGEAYGCSVIRAAAPAAPLTIGTARTGSDRTVLWQGEVRQHASPLERPA